MHVVYNAGFTAKGLASKLLTFLKENYWKYQVMEKLLDQVIGKSFSSK